MSFQVQATTKNANAVYLTYTVVITLPDIGPKLCLLVSLYKDMCYMSKGSQDTWSDLCLLASHLCDMHHVFDVQDTLSDLCLLASHLYVTCHRVSWPCLCSCLSHVAMQVLCVIYRVRKVDMVLGLPRTCYIGGPPPCNIIRDVGGMLR